MRCFPSGTVNVELQVGQVTESVEVVAVKWLPRAAQHESAAVGKTVEQTQIQNLTLNGRNPLFLALLKPGVRGGALSGFSFGLTSGGFAINGGRSQDSVITFDGAVASARAPTAPRSAPPTSTPCRKSRS
jgi:hypothetical protein